MTNPLQNIEIETMDEQKEQFKITNLDTANWAFRKISAINKKLEEINFVARDEMERITKWQESESKSLDDSREYFEHLLIEYYKANRENDPKFKLSTPYGKMSSRKGTVKWDMPNKALVIEQLEQRGFDDLVKVKKDVNLAEMKNTFSIAGNNVVDSNGELLEGAYISVNPRTYSVKVD